MTNDILGDDSEGDCTCRTRHRMWQPRNDDMRARAWYGYLRETKGTRGDSVRLHNRTNLILALLYAPDGSGRESAPILGVTRLEKLLFLLTKEAGLLTNADNEERFSFIPHKFGPFSSEVYDEVDFLEALGLVDSRRV